MCRDSPQAIETGYGHCLSMKTLTRNIAPRLGRIPLMGRYHNGSRSVTDDYFITDKVLGKGSSGQVCEAVGITDGTHKVAVKEFSVSKLRTVEKDHLKGELETYLCLDHPHVARLIDVYDHDDKVSLVMECIEGGLLFQRVQEKKRYSELEAATAMRQILLAVTYLHSHGIAHRDLKLENIMYDSKDSDHLKLIDFGFSTFSRGRRFKTVCGTLSYVAPEVLSENYGRECDLWSAGVIAYIMLAGTMPFFGSKDEKMKAISGGKYRMKPEIWNPLSDFAKGFVKSLLCMDPASRLDAHAALAHPWIQEFGLTESPVKKTYDIANALTTWHSTPKFLQACFTLMAWNLNKDEHAKVRDYFLHFDSDHNGTISLEELKTVMEGKCGLDEKTLRRTVLSLGSKSDEEIHYSNFVAALMSNHIIDVNDNLIETAFRKFDKSNKGFITVDDFKNVVGDEYYDASSSLLLEPDVASASDKIGFDEFSAYIQLLRKDAAKRNESKAKKAIKDMRSGKERRQNSQNSKEVKEAQPACCTLM